MSSQVISDHRQNAEIYTDSSECKLKFLQLLEEIHLPKGLLPLDDVVEVGYNRNTGFVWLKQKKKKQNKFDKIGKTVSYDTEVTGFVEARKMKRLTGVKSKEILIWVTLNEISIDEKDLDKITFCTPSGISRSFPVSAFELQDK